MNSSVPAKPTIIADIDGARMLQIDAHSDRLPGSVFLSGPQGWCVEFDRATFVRAVLDELGIVDPLELLLEI